MKSGFIVRSCHRAVRQLSTPAAKEPLVTIQYPTDAHPHVAFLTLNTPSQMNALTEVMGDEFILKVRELKAACEEQRVRAVILRGAGDNFSAGGNLAWLKQRATTGAFQNSIIMNNFYRRFLCIREIPAPVIAMVQGYAVGAGCCLTLAADVRLVSKKASLGFTFPKLGIHPGMGCTLLLPRIVSSDVANHLLLSGQVLKGDVAAQKGLALEALDDEVCPNRIIYHIIMHQYVNYRRSCYKERWNWLLHMLPIVLFPFKVLFVHCDTRRLVCKSVYIYSIPCLFGY
jgi:enoyl-CoA hydratase/carnithine racemase